MYAHFPLPDVPKLPMNAWLGSKVSYGCVRAMAKPLNRLSVLVPALAGSQARLYDADSARREGEYDILTAASSACWAGGLHLAPAAHGACRGNDGAGPHGAANVPVVPRRHAAAPRRPPGALASTARGVPHGHRARGCGGLEGSALRRRPCSRHQGVVLSHPRRFGGHVLGTTRREMRGPRGERRGG